MNLPDVVAPRALVGTADLLMLDEGALNRMMNLAEVMASCKSTLPPHYRNSPGDCLAVIMQSVHWRMNPFAVAQQTYSVNNQIGYQGQLVNAVVESSGAIEGTFEYEWFGPWERIIGKFEIRKGDKGEYRVPAWSLKDEEGIGIRITAITKVDHKKKTLELLLAQCRVRNSTLWADDPKQQMAYLAVRRWARLHTPGVMLGLNTPDEIMEEAGERFMGAAEVVRDDDNQPPPSSPPPPPSSRAQQLKERVKKKAEVITLEQVVDKIAGTTTLEQLHDAARLAMQLANESEKEIARKYYAERASELKAQSVSPPPPNKINLLRAILARLSSKTI